jgi:hypothetical protein
MNSYRSFLGISFFAVASLAFTSLAQAEATRTWVSGVGDDVNPCSRTAPCKTFAGAISKTARGGEINVLDAGGYGAITITKSITIDGTGAMASILGSKTNGIVINITDEADTAKTVRIRGLSLNGVRDGLQGIKVIAVNKLFVENTVIDNFADGISIAAPASQVFVKDVTISNNSGAGISASAAGSKVAMSNVTVIYNGTSLVATGGAVIVSLKNNTVYGNKKDGETASPAVTTEEVKEPK